MKKRSGFYLLLCLVLVFALALPAAADEGGENTGGEGSGSTTHTHAYDGGTVTTAPTCNSEGVKTFTCACGETRTEPVAIAPDAHSFSWTVTEGGHSAVCSRCGTKGTEGTHAWGNPAVTAATCQNQGVKEYTCSVCGHKKSEVIPVSTTHNFGNWTKVDDATHNRTCKDCSAADTAAAHSWGSGTVTTAATCKDEGAMEYVCVCGAKKTAAIAKLTTHTYDNPCDPDCNVCGAVRKAEHKISKIWTRNSRHHWHECSVCEGKFDEEDHFPGPAATEEQEQICLVCGLMMMPKKGHTHEYETTYSSNEEGHWYACKGCEDQKDLKAHVFDNPCDPDCNECGYSNPSAHYYGDTLQYDEEGHWGECTLCGVIGNKDAHIPGDEATEEAPQICIICGMEMAPVVVHVHEAVQWQCDEVSHKHLCICGEAMEEGEHVWGEGTENPDSTVTYVCKCGTEMTKGTPKKEGGFPIWILLVAAVVLLGAAGVVAVLLIMKRKPAGKFSR